ncbi:hypothetical protein MVEN_02138000 [Mycena venus]|uniref:DUF7918 domain-containing protein n=1 Tax=Mycena venus TaxID=2733690 RepID=A0A8H7CGP0_9AGAR|nr:hypothetical protein MVEN_02138000 [Mycena venus]
MDSKADRARIIYGFVAVDGIDCGGRELNIVRTGDRWIGTGHRDSVATSPTMRRPLLFGKQQITDDDRYLNAPISPDLGSITMELNNVSVYRTPPRLRYFVSAPSQKLHERSKKAIGHSVQFGAEFRTDDPFGGLVIESHSLKVLNRLAKFTFRYRSLDLLKANGIAPADKPRPGQRSAAQAVEIPDDEEAIASQIKALQDKLAAVRKKSQPGSSKINKKVKVEKSIFLPGEIIDLT